MEKKKTAQIEVNELMDIHSLIINMYKEGYLDGYLHGKDLKWKTPKKKNKVWEKIQKKAYKDFQKFIKLKGGIKQKK